MATAVLKKNRTKSIDNRHPWIFSGSIHRESGQGGLIRVQDPDRKDVAWGVYNPLSPIRIRVIDYQSLPDHPERLIAERIRDAASMRRALLPPDVNAFRLINGEGDGLPGVTADVYDELMVVSTSCGGWETIREDYLISHLKRTWPVKSVYLKNHSESRKSERLPLKDSWLSSYTLPMPIQIREHEFNYLVDVEKGQNTGFFMDHRANRRLVSHYSHGTEVLNVFSYTGAFSIAALKGGATFVTNVDSSLDYLDLGRENHRLNDFNESVYTQVKENAFEHLKYLSRHRRKFDLIILDPPVLCKSGQALKSASWSYRELNIHAMNLLRPGGYLLTCSRSSYVSSALFRQIIFGAAREAGVSMRMLHAHGADWDHPVDLYCPESEYLKSIMLRIR